MKNRRRLSFGCFAAPLILLLVLTLSGCEKSTPDVVTEGLDEGLSEEGVISITNAELAAATYKSDYSATLEGANGSGNYTFAVSGLPAGMALTGNVISGKPEAIGNFSLAVVMTEAEGGESVEKTLDLLVNKETPNVIVFKQFEPDLMWFPVEGDEVSVKPDKKLGFKVEGGAPAYTWSLVGINWESQFCLTTDSSATTCAPPLVTSIEGFDVYLMCSATSLTNSVTIKVKVESAYSNPVEKSVTFSTTSEM